MLKKAFNPPGRAKRRKQVDLQTPGQPFANKAGLARSHQSAFQKARTHYPIDAYIGLGSNLDNPHQQVVSALAALAGIPGTRLFAFSGLYMSRPMGPADQPAYINAVAWLKTGRTPDGLLAALQAIENRHGRIRHGARWGPRSLDLDILVYGKRRRPAGRNAKHILQHQYLTAAIPAGADTDHRNADRAGNVSRQGGGNTLNQQHIRAGLLKRACGAAQLLGAAGIGALHVIAA